MLEEGKGGRGGREITLPWEAENFTNVPLQIPHPVFPPSPRHIASPLATDTPHTHDTQGGDGGGGSATTPLPHPSQ